MNSLKENNSSTTIQQITVVEIQQHLVEVNSQQSFKRQQKTLHFNF